MLTAKTPDGVFSTPVDAASNFTVKFTMKWKEIGGEKLILEIPSVLYVQLRQHDPSDRDRQNYPACKMPDGSVPVLEATVVLHSVEHPDWRNMTIGIPLALLQNPSSEHEVVLHFSGTHWRMFVDGEMLDNDFPFGFPRWESRCMWRIDPEHVSEAAVYVPEIRPECNETLDTGGSSDIQYWLPPGHNTWVGDVVTYFYKERYHVFYLYDRRHHANKFGAGSHYFEHLSTADFHTWTEHEAATPLEEQWECIGTGTPFVLDGRLYLAYGLHTERIYPDEQTTLPLQEAYYSANGRTGTFKHGAPYAPIGATYSVSDDGIGGFKKSWVFYHPCRNPSIYRDPNGELRMMANSRSKGMWTSESVDGGWRCISPDFPPGVDCTFFFRWDRFDYIIGGSKHLWYKPADAPDTAYKDSVAEGFDIYDGLNVPAITEIPGGRFLMAGWTHIRGWGGNLVIRELLQFPDGRIGSKWMEELIPETVKPKTLEAEVVGTRSSPIDDRTFMLTFRVRSADTGTGRFGIVFLPEEGELNACELQIRLDEMRAQFGAGSMEGFAGPEKTLREGGAPHHCGNYAIENLIGTDGPFTVRVIVVGDDKIGGSLLDVEIAGKRTMISYRPDLTVKKLIYRLEGVEFGEVQLSRIK